ncbi:MAG: hypothetical protein AAGA85_02025 [Bacteroidota bacterium]
MGKLFVLFLLLILGQPAMLIAQLPFFDHPERIALVKQGGDYIYNLEQDSADLYIQKVKKELPGHPIGPLMEGIQLLWKHLPVLDDPTFDQFLDKMKEAVAKAQSLGKADEDHPEALFFELAARGLMAEYFADRDEYRQALSEATKAYALVKRGFDLTDEISEFLFTTGLYNYFREKYPQMYPIYKPFVWIFKSGDKELGLAQLDKATRETVVSRIEAHIYISYIYLRYEDTPVKAQEYLSFLVEQYPNNLYLISKYLEAFRDEAFLPSVPLPYIKKLQGSTRPYFRLAGNVFMGLYQERVKNNYREAFDLYGEGIRHGEELTSHGEFYKSLAYLGMGRILADDRPEAAQVHLEQALEYAETKDVKKEARTLLRR